MHAKRAGISLLEVLISMFVLLVGLAGIAALLPAGRTELLSAYKLDNAMIMGRNTINELRAREILDPSNWYSTDSTGNGQYSVWDASNPAQPRFQLPNVTGSQRYSMPVALDPLGIAAPGGSFGNAFPYGATLGDQSLVRIYRGPVNPGALYAAADLLCRSHDDLILQTNSKNQKDPPEIRSTSDSRMSNGNFSWFATLVPEPRSIRPTEGGPAPPWTISVAVVFKRDLSKAGAGEYIVQVQSMPGSGVAGGEVVLDNPPRAAKPGQYLMLTGTEDVVEPGPPPRTWQYHHFRWFKIVGADTLNNKAQQVSLTGPDWVVPANRTQAWLFDNVVAVYERALPLAGTSD